MKTVATFVRQLNNSRADQRLYACDEPMPWEDYDDDGDKVTKFATHVVVSAAWTPDHGNETYIFPADASGDIVSWLELPGSFVGGLDHNRALRGAGYEPEYP